MSDVTRILSAIEQGDPSAASQLLPLVYDELRQLAAQKLAHEQPGQTLQATALVHEAYLRLVGEGEEPQTPGTAGGTSSPPPPRPCAASSSRTPAARAVRNAVGIGDARTSTSANSPPPHSATTCWPWTRPSTSWPRRSMERCGCGTPAATVRARRRWRGSRRWSPGCTASP